MPTPIEVFMAERIQELADGFYAAVAELQTHNVEPADIIRTAADLNAKAMILAAHASSEDGLCVEDGQAYPCKTILISAHTWSHCEGFLPEWEMPGSGAFWGCPANVDKDWIFVDTCGVPLPCEAHGISTVRDGIEAHGNMLYRGDGAQQPEPVAGNG